MTERTELAGGIDHSLATAARVLASVAEDGRSLDWALLAERERPGGAATRAIATGAVRWYLRLAPLLDRLTDQPLDPTLRSLLICALHQLEYSRTPAPTIVSRAVEAGRLAGHARAAGLINAILRRFLRERETLIAPIDGRLAGRTAHPAWLVDRLVADWGEARTAELLDANNAHPPMTLRVNRLKTSVEAFRVKASLAGIVASAVQWAPDALILDRGRNVQKVPGFFEGEVSVQDAGAQLAPPALACGAGMRVLDTCAAPGGKTGHLLEHTPRIGELVANDLSRARLKRVAENLDRLGLRATLTAFDARTLRGLGGSDFERVLVDAPCSGTGVIRRHPDIKLLRRSADLEAMVAIQNEILEAAFSRLRAGGRLLYVTCSVVQQENEGVVRGFLTRHRNARPGGFEHSMLLPPDAICFESAFQMLPGSRSDTDGFYYACIEKTTTGI